ncbi:2TM domain-containing protein [Microcoleus sp. F4-D5]|uniref:2TM domain-containing protein n=1 Tax=Microcoleus sp. F4-D5 TaxID=2818760 RepID=UPI002FD46187
MKFLLPSKRVRGGLGWGKKFTTPARIAIAAVRGLDWSLLILLRWGLGLSLTAWNVDRTEGEEYEKAFGRWRLKKQVGQ